MLFRESKVKTSKGERWEFLLLQHKNHNWGFPKGRREKGENDLQTAKREIFEETGFSSVRFIKRLESVIKFTVYRGRNLLPKEIRLFLARVGNDVQVKLSQEHLDYKWLPYEDALSNITHKSAKKLLKEANRWIEENATLLKGKSNLENDKT